MNTNSAQSNEEKVINKQEKFVQEENNQIQNLKENYLNPEEYEKAQEMANNFDISSEDNIINFGYEIQQKLGNASDTNNIMDQIEKRENDDITHVMEEIKSRIKYVDPSGSEEDSKISHFFKNKIGKIIPSKIKKGSSKLKKAYKRFNAISSKIEDAVTTLDKKKEEVKQDNTSIKNSFQNNVEYLKEVRKYIQSLKIKIDEIENEIIPQKEKEIEENDDRFLKQELNELKRKRELLYERLNDLSSSEAATFHYLPQLCTIHYNNVMQIKELNTSINTTIPVWKNQITSAFLIKSQTNRIDQQRQLDSLVNSTIESNAKTIEENSKKLVEQSYDSALNSETLEKATQNVMKAIENIEEGSKNKIEAIKENQNKHHEIIENVKSGFHSFQNYISNNGQTNEGKYINYKNDDDGNESNDN